MIIISDKTVALWFLPDQEGASDVLMCLEDKGGYFELMMRMRVYADDDPWTNKDRKQWYKKRFDTGRAEALEECRKIVTLLEADAGNPADEIIYESEEQFYSELFQHEWAHVKKAPRGEADVC